jgi:hypothetical protein
MRINFSTTRMDRRFAAIRAETSVPAIYPLTTEGWSGNHPGASSHNPGIFLIVIGFVIFFHRFREQEMMLRIGDRKLAQHEATQPRGTVPQALIS